jgi:hypothetical protein
MIMLKPRLADGLNRVRCDMRDQHLGSDDHESTTITMGAVQELKNV